MKGFPMQKGTGSYLKEESAAKMKKEAAARMKKETIAKQRAEGGGGSKPDFLDLDGDGNKKESMKAAASAAKQKAETGKEEQARKDKEDKAFADKRKKQIQSNIDKMIKEEQDKYTKSLDSLNTVRSTRKTQQQKDYETMSAAEYAKKYGNK